MLGEDLFVLLGERDTAMDFLYQDESCYDTSIISPPPPISLE